MGDYNSRTKNLDDTICKEKHDHQFVEDFYSKITTKRCNQDQNENGYGPKLVEFCISSGLYIANGRTLGDFQGKLTCHQWNGSSTVDYTILSQSLKSSIRHFQVLDSATGSDHSPLEIELRTKKRPNPVDDKIIPLVRSIRWNDQNKLLFQNKMSSEETSNKLENIDKMIQEQNDVNLIVGKLSEIYSLPQTTNQKGKQRKKKKQPHKKWYDESCQKLSRNLKKTTELLSKTPNNPHLRGNFCRMRKEFKKFLKKRKKEWKQSIVKDLERMEESDPQEYWKLVNMLKETKNRDAHFDADSFTTFFEKLYTASDKKDLEIEKVVQESLDKFINFSTEPDFTMKELIKAINKLKNNKAAGPDRIPAEMLKASPNSLLTIILKTINLIKSSFLVPDNWAVGITSLILKEGDDTDPDNYRAITVTDALAKVFAILINERLEQWTTANNIQKKEQIGFTKKCRPADHLLVLKTVIDTYNETSRKVYTCFVDFRKAFDSVWRVGLFYKMIKTGINTGYVKLIKNMYEKTSQCLKLNNGITRSFRTTRGVRQGCILSPYAFKIFLNDLPEVFDGTCDPVKLGNERISCLLYADDLVLLSESKQGLQTCLDKLHDYAQKWDLKVNLSKTKIMIFQKGGRKTSSDFFIGDQKLDHSSKYKYLGTIVSDSGSFKLNEKNLKAKGLRASFLITKNVSSISKPSTAIKIFEKTVEPILLYNSEITGACIPNSWTYEKFKEKLWEIGQPLDRVTVGFLRQTLGVHKKTANLAIQAETGKLPICIKIFDRVIKYWIRLQSTQNPLLLAARDADALNFSNQRKNWTKMAIFLRKLTNIDGLSVDTPVDENRALNLFKDKVMELFTGWWDSQRNNKTKLDFYYKYKKVFRYESYLDNIPKNIRCYITRLRVSAHCLPVEVLRYTKNKKIDRESRLCHICNTNQIGDEEHYLMRCQNAEVSHIRKLFFEKIRNEVAQLDQFSEKNILDYCLNMNDEKTQMYIAEYVKDILTTYREETGDSKPQQDIPVKTKSGRLVKKTRKMNL